MKRRATMHQIAELAEVSLGTVSHVVTGSANVREPLRSRVLAAIRSLGYQPNQLARGLRRNHTNIIGMIIPDITNPFFPAVVRGVEDVAFRHSYQLVLCNTDNDAVKEGSYIHELRTFLPAGLIVIPSSAGDLSAWSESAIVCVDRRPKTWTGDTVTVANEEGVYRATRHLLGIGHRRVAMISGPRYLTNTAERVAGFKRALREFKIIVQPEYIQESPYDRESGRIAALRLLRLLPRPTAIVTASDLISLGAISALRELHLRCPEDISVIGFDGLDLTDFTEPSLSTVYQSGYQLGAEAARLLLHRIKNPESPVGSVVLDVELRIKNSVAPPMQETSPTAKSRRQPKKSYKPTAIP